MASGSALYSLTAKPQDAPGTPWYARPALLGTLVLGATAALNIMFW